VFQLFPALSGLLNRKGGFLSGGQQQQLAIARALVTEPKLLLLDEPTEGIQPSIIQEIEEVIARIKAQGLVTILLVEQYLEFAWRLADAFYMMEKGSIVAHGEIAELTEDVVKQYLTV
jgi:urea transport system ATP-binding protein